MSTAQQDHVFRRWILECGWIIKVLTSLVDQFTDEITWLIIGRWWPHWREEIITLWTWRHLVPRPFLLGFFHSFLLPGCHEVSNFLPPCLSTMMFLIHHSLTINTALWPWTETSETLSQNNFLPLNYLFHVVCHSNKKLTNTFTDILNLFT